MAGLRPRREVNYNAPAGGSGTPAWLKVGAIPIHNRVPHCPVLLRVLLRVLLHVR